MTLQMKSEITCPHCFSLIKEEQPFDTWCRNQPGLDSVKDGVVAFDNDLIVHKYRFDSMGKNWQCLLFVEVKSMGKDMDDAQRDTLGMWSQLMDNMHLANPGDLGPCFRVWSVKNQKEIFLRCYGVHCLRLERTTPDNSAWIEWDWTFRITKEQLVGLFRFELDPKDPSLTLSMDERFKRTDVPAILAKGNSQCLPSLSGK